MEENRQNCSLNEIADAIASRIGRKRDVLAIMAASIYATMNDPSWGRTVGIADAIYAEATARTEREAEKG